MASRRNSMWTFMVASLRVSPAKSAMLLCGTVVLVFLLVRQFSGGAAEADAAMLLDADIVAVPVDTDSVPRASKKLERLPRPRVAASLLRNPFGLNWIDIRASRIGDQESAAEDEQLEELTLQFTMTEKRKGKDAVAVISGVAVRLGEALGPYTIVQIGERHVVMRDGKEEVTLTMR